MGPWIGALAAFAQVRMPQRKARRALAPSDWGRWLGEPRNVVLFALASVLLLGGGRKALQAWRARRAIGRLGDDDVTPAEVEAAADHGRSGLIDLFRILGTAANDSLRDAAGRALARLWAQDNLIAEEEKALIRRGFVVNWRARRRYPRALQTPIPISVSYGVPFLRVETGVGPANLEWSHQVLGARRAGLETFSPWRPGPGQAGFTIFPGDFDTNGPHKIVLHTRVRTVGLTDSWELALPLFPFHFEFDPMLVPGSLASMLDDARAERYARAVRFEPTAADESRPATFLNVTNGLALRDPPQLVVTTPVSSDLAHSVEIEFEGVDGRYPAGSVVLTGQGTGQDEVESLRRFPLGAIADLPAGAIESPGTRRLRAILTADADLGWADPDVRSIWPGTIVTDWVEVRVVRT